LQQVQIRKAESTADIGIGQVVEKGRAIEDLNPYFLDSLVTTKSEHNHEPDVAMIAHTSVSE